MRISTSALASPGAVQNRNNANSAATGNDANLLQVPSIISKVLPINGIQPTENQKPHVNNGAAGSDKRASSSSVNNGQKRERVHKDKEKKVSYKVLFTV